MVDNTYKNDFTYNKLMNEEIFGLKVILYIYILYSRRIHRKIICEYQHRVDSLFSTSKFYFL